MRQWGITELGQSLRRTGTESRLCVCWGLARHDDAEMENRETSADIRPGFLNTTPSLIRRYLTRVECHLLPWVLLLPSNSVFGERGLKLLVSLHFACLAAVSHLGMLAIVTFRLVPSLARPRQAS